MHSIAELVAACNKALHDKGFAMVSERTIRQDLKNIQADYDAAVEKKLVGHSALYRYADPDFSIVAKMLPEGVSCAICDAMEAIAQLGDAPYLQWVNNVLGQLLIDAPIDEARNVHFSNNPYLHGLQFFPNLVGYIINKRPIEITYKAYAKEQTTCVMYPYLLKQYNERWFLIGRDEGYDTLTVRPLDRIVEIKESNARFQGPDIDLEEYFDSMVGVTIEPDDSVETIVLKVDPMRYNYIKTKPIHSSQTELHALSDDDAKYIRLSLRVNRELIALLLSFGRDIEVLQPASLRERMRQQANEMAAAYAK